MKKELFNIPIFNIKNFTNPKSIRGDSSIEEEIQIKKNNIYIPKKINKSNNNGIKGINIEKFNSTNSNPDNEKNHTFFHLQNENYKYKINTNPSDFIFIPQSREYPTNDKDLKNLIDLMNEPITSEYGYTNVINEENCMIYKKLVEGSPVVLIKCIAKLPYDKDIIFEAIANLEIRKQWDSVFSELRVVNHEGENGAEILYMIIKSPVFIVSNRDFVQQRKMWKNFPTEKSHIIHFISVESPECPINKKIVRAETVISGYYMESIPDEPGYCKFGVLSQTDIKGNIPTFLVNKFAPKSSKSWMKSLLKGCKIVLENMNKITPKIEL